MCIRQQMDPELTIEPTDQPSFIPLVKMMCDYIRMQYALCQTLWHAIDAVNTDKSNTVSENVNPAPENSRTLGLAHTKSKYFLYLLSSLAYDRSPTGRQGDVAAVTHQIAPRSVAVATLTMIRERETCLSYCWCRSSQSKECTFRSPNSARSYLCQRHSNRHHYSGGWSHIM